MWWFMLQPTAQGKHKLLTRAQDILLAERSHLCPVSLSIHQRQTGRVGRALYWLRLAIFMLPKTTGWKNTSEQAPFLPCWLTLFALLRIFLSCWSPMQMQCFSFSHCYLSSCIAPSPTYVCAASTASCHVLFFPFFCSDHALSSPCSQTPPINQQTQACISCRGGEEQKGRKRRDIMVSVPRRDLREDKATARRSRMKIGSRTLALAIQVASGLCMVSAVDWMPDLLCSCDSSPKDRRV